MRVRLELMNQGGTVYAVRAPRGLVKGHRKVTVRVGQRQVQAYCSTGSAQATLGLNAALLSKMNLRRGMRLHARFEAGVLHIGPLVGILVPGTRGLPNPIGNMTLGVRYLIEQGRAVGVYPFAFACSAVDFKRGVVRGYTLSLGGDEPRWVRRLFPLPDVVYDHITYRRRDRSADIRKLRARFAEAQIPLFNQGFFDKWEVHNRLLNSPEMLPHLPETQLLGPETLEQMTASYRRLFIKPALRTGMKSSVGGTLISSDHANHLVTTRSECLADYRRAHPDLIRCAGHCHSCDGGSDRWASFSPSSSWWRSSWQIWRPSR
jgi:hypothetical protein